MEVHVSFVQNIIVNVCFLRIYRIYFILFLPEKNIIKKTTLIL